MAWQLQEAKQRFSELVRRAIHDGPQTVTLRGQPAVVVLSSEDFDQLSAQDDFADFLCGAPDLEELELPAREFARQVDLDG